MATAARLYGTACDLGEPRACISLGFLYEVGRGVPKSAERARVFHKKACDSGDQQGCFRLAAAYAELGPASNEDLRAAARINKQCCERGHGGCCFAAALSSRLGRGVPVNVDESRKLFERACACADAGGCIEAASMYEQLGGEVSQTRAHDLYRRALSSAEHGCVENDGAACWHLAEILRRGLGLQPDLARATAAAEKACKLGVMMSCKRDETTAGR
jgi:TPR repeat protein